MPASAALCWAGTVLWAHTRRAGGFAGLAGSRFTTAGSGQDLSATTVLGGFYLGHDMGQSFLDANIIFGHAAFESRAQSIYNNLVAGGIETASASYGGWLFSPSAKLGTDMAVTGGTLTPSVSLRYVGMPALDGYAETGSAARSHRWRGARREHLQRPRRTGPACAHPAGQRTGPVVTRHPRRRRRHLGQRSHDRRQWWPAPP